MLKTLNKYYEAGLLYKQTHPTLPLTIWNYSEKVQYDNLWDEITIQARGLVTDDAGKIVARPFSKFWNIEEAKHTSTTEFEVYDKMDGSLGIAFNYGGNWIMATRGSFVSEQAIKGKEMLDKLNHKYGMYSGYTYLFEIIYPQNRIVVDYAGVEKLVVLGVIHTETGKEGKFEEMVNEGFEIVKKYDGIKDYTTLKALIGNNQEGFVVKFSNGHRCKIKGDVYIRLHRIMTNVSTTSIWEVLKNGDNVEDLLKDVPDEFYDKIQEYVKELRKQFLEIKVTTIKLYNEYHKTYGDIFIGAYNERKEYANWVRSHPTKIQGILFRMYDNKEYESAIWKLIKPEYIKL